MSVAGGVDRAIGRGRAAGCEVLQIFTKSSNQRAARPFREDEVAAFHQGQAETGIPVLTAHDSYLINLASPAEELRRKSIDAFREEMTRAERLGIPYLVFHPGSHVGTGEAEGCARIAAALNELHADTPGFKLTVLLENAAGQGSAIGHRFEHLAEILGQVADNGRLGVCLDTCHAHAAGYELRTPGGFETTIAEFDRLVGLERLRALHLNDSKGELGCRVDRHWHIGHGRLGLEPFRLFQNDPRFHGLPGMLETPKGEECAEDIVNLGVLRALAGDAKSKPIPEALTPLDHPLPLALAQAPAAPARAARKASAPGRVRRNAGP
jgi:deoxyribonuclease-4